MDEIVRRITVVGTGPHAGPAEVVYEKEHGEEKSSRLLKPLEMMQRRVLETGKVMVEEVLAQQEKRSRKHKDSWLRDAPVIAFKANKKAMKKLIDW